ncbi:ion transporter [Alkalihalophilus marmarensis DSM 21297]|jgi:potassium channel LctB|nr:ion transporter [Alkalihalophilus marmarensis DSM 21297]
MFVAALGVIMSFLLLLRYKPMRGRHKVSLRHFAMLVNVYVTVMLAFALMYMVLELLGIPVLAEANRNVGGELTHLVLDVVYFSAITLLSVGYGDIVPMGVGRILAIIQALFGYLLPAAFVVTTVIRLENKVE